MNCQRRVGELSSPGLWPCSHEVEFCHRGAEPLGHFMVMQPARQVGHGNGAMSWKKCHHMVRLLGVMHILGSGLCQCLWQLFCIVCTMAFDVPT